MNHLGHRRRARSHGPIATIGVAVLLASLALTPAQAHQRPDHRRRPDAHAEVFRRQDRNRTDALAAALPAGFEETVAFSGLTEPMSVAFSPDGRVFVAEKSGLIKVFDGLTDPTPATFADLSTNVYDFFDRGLMSIALAPGFPADPYLYALYAYDGDIGGPSPKWGTPGVLSDPCPNPPGATSDGCVISGRLSRMRADGATAGPEQVLVNGWCQQFPSHSLGDIAFAPDGALYVTGGDGASFGFADYGQEGDPLNPCGDPPAGVGGVQTPPTAEGGALRSQDIRTTGDPTGLNGAVLRLDPTTGAALPSNPNAGGSDQNAARIVAYGLRNPFRMTFRPGTDDLWIGDVGWNKFEEINVLRSPASPVENYGWPCYEGPIRQGQYDGLDLNLCETLYAQGSTVTGPVYSYRRPDVIAPDDGCQTGTSTISALTFYRGGSYPSQYNGALIFGDYSRGCIWVAFRGAGGDPDFSTRTGFVSPAQFPVDLEIGPGGDVFYVDIVDGQVRRISYTNGNHTPTAIAEASATYGPLPLDVHFDGTDSTDPDPNDSLTYAWDLDGDGQFDDSNSATPSKTYTQAGNVAVGLQVQDPSGAIGTDVVLISPGESPPTATILTPKADLKWSVDDQISFSGSASDQQDGALPASALTWHAVLRHCPSVCHTHFIEDFAGVAGGSFQAPDHEYPSYIDITLVATDSAGLQDTETLELSSNAVNLTFVTSPSGLQIEVAGTPTTTPFTIPVTVGSTNGVNAPSPQSPAGGTYFFDHWSDGGSQAHDIIAPAVPTTYTAVFQQGTPTDITVSDFAFTPSSININFGTPVRWNFVGPSVHTATSRSLNLFDSGNRSPGQAYAYTFFGAGTYTYRCSIHTTMSGTVHTRMAVAPNRGGTTTTYQATWASSAPPAGYVFDVQIRRPGGVYTDWKAGTTLINGTFVPDAGTGKYSFRTRLRNVATTRASGWSPVSTINVS